MSDTLPVINAHFAKDGHPDGGISCGMGFTISWQRGSLVNGRNGAFIIEVLESCKDRLSEYEKTAFACKENAVALEHLNQCIINLKARRHRREQEGSYGTHTPDQVSFMSREMIDEASESLDVLYPVISDD